MGPAHVLREQKITQALAAQAAKEKLEPVMPRVRDIQLGVDA